MAIEKNLLIQPDLIQSAKQFDSLIWPKISPLIGGGEYFSIEGDQNDALKLILDRFAGLDGFIFSNNQIKGVAARVQTTERAYDTFTIRLSRSSGTQTELAKRIQAINTPGSLFPTWTIQGYVSPYGHALSAAAIETDSLYRFLEREAPKAVLGRSYVVKVLENRDDGNMFLSVDWDRLSNVQHVYPNLNLSPVVWRLSA